jgi:O-antigen ligase
MEPARAARGRAPDTRIVDVTGVSQRFGPLGAWWTVALAALCAAVGLLSGYRPEYGLLAGVGIAFAAAVLADLTVGFVLFTGISFLDLLSGSGSFSGTKVIGLLLFGSWIARMTTERRAALASFVSQNPWLVVGLVAMLGWCVLSFAWAQSPSTALAGAGRYALDIILLPIAFAAVRERRHVTWVFTAYVLGTAISCLYGFVHPTSQASSFAGRLTGSLGDPNAEATVLVASLALLIGLTGTIRHSARLKLGALVVAAILFAGLVSTLSREGLLSLAAAIVVAVIFGGRWRGRAALLLVVAVAATGGYYFVAAPLAARERVTMSDTSGRTSIWRVAWRVVKAHPLLGVGNDNFILVEGSYVSQPGSVLASYLIDAPKVAHNAYLEALVDLGVPGLVTFLAVMAACLAAAVRAAWIFDRIGEREMELMARALILAIVVVLVSNLFVSGNYEKFRWLLLALCPAMLAIARREAAARRPAGARRRRHRGPPPRLRLGAAR